MGRSFKWPFVAPANSNSSRRAEKRAHSIRKALEGAPTKSNFTKQVVAQNGRCWFCNELMGGDCTREHLLARAFGGSNHPRNIVAAHSDCNSAAGHLLVAQKQKLREVGHRLGRLAVIDLAHRMRRADAEYAFRPHFEAEAKKAEGDTK